MRLTILICMLAMSGCAALDVYKFGAAQKAADMMDRIRADAEWVICRAISIGSWQRAYGDSASRAQAWRDLCRQPLTELPRDEL